MSAFLSIILSLQALGHLDAQTGNFLAEASFGRILFAFVQRGWRGK